MFPERVLAKARLLPSGLNAGAKAWLPARSPLRFATLCPSKIFAR
jgi:hypothetical protein